MRSSCNYFLVWMFILVHHEHVLFKPTTWPSPAVADTSTTSFRTEVWRLLIGKESRGVFLNWWKVYNLKCIANSRGYGWKQSCRDTSVGSDKCRLSGGSYLGQERTVSPALDSGYASHAAHLLDEWWWCSDDEIRPASRNVCTIHDSICLCWNLTNGQKNGEIE